MICDTFNVARPVMVSLPVSPRLVVTKTTPLAPRVPYTAVAEASFRILNDFTSSGSMSSRRPSIPSISTNAPELAPKVLIPRIQKLEMFFPGSPELCMVMTPANRPPIMLLREVPGVLSWATSMVLIAPTTDIFFCEVIPVTTTSSSLVSSSSNVTLSVISSLVTSFSIDFIPIA